MKIKPIKIGDVTLQKPLVLAPMVDVSDLAYRLICRKAGAALAYTEMLYIDSILHNSEKIKKLMKTCAEDRPIGLQITGNNEKEFEKFVNSKKWREYDIIDINCGCPSTRIVGNEAGSYLLTKPKKIANFIKILKSTGKPVTVKIRLGFEKNNVIKIAKIIEKAGASCITLHARLAIDSYKVKADWRWIKKIKEKTKIPIIGNGDVFSGKDAKELMRETNCDAVMIARGAIGDPLIFDRIITYLEKNKEKKINFEENLRLFEEYLNLAEKHNVLSIERVKYIGTKFIKNFENSAKMRSEFMQLKNLTEIKLFIKKIKLPPSQFLSF